MKSFNTVYDKSKELALSEQKKSAQNEHAVLISAIKKEYMIDNFNSLAESQKMSFKSMINEMWNPVTGLTEKGRQFINEGKTILTEKSTIEDIETYFKKKVGNNIGRCMKSIVLGQSCDLVSNIKKDIEEQTKKPLNVNKCKKWLFDLCGKNLAESIKSLEFETLNETLDLGQFSTKYIAFQCPDNYDELMKGPLKHFIVNWGDHYTHIMGGLERLKEYGFKWVYSMNDLQGLCHTVYKSYSAENPERYMIVDNTDPKDPTVNCYMVNDLRKGVKESFGASSLRNKLNEKELTDDEREKLVTKLEGLLHKGEVKFKFKKVDGSIRTARGTLKKELMPKKERETTRTRRTPDTCVCYWDLDKEDFGSFRKDLLIEIL